MGDGQEVALLFNGPPKEGGAESELVKEVAFGRC